MSKSAYITEHYGEYSKQTFWMLHTPDNPDTKAEPFFCPKEAQEALRKYLAAESEAV